MTFETLPRKLPLRALAAAIATVISLALAGCQAAQSMRAFYSAGNLTVLVCDRPNLDGCQFLPTVNISGAPAKVNTHELPADIVSNGLRSFSVVCGRPTVVLAYEFCNFRGRVAAFHCQPGQTLEVQSLGPLAGNVRGLVFSDETQTSDLQHTAIPFSDPAIVPALHLEISAGLTGGTAGASPTFSPNECAVLPQCCAPSGPTAPSGSTGLAASTPFGTDVYWTEPINVFDELPQYGDRVFRTDPCPVSPETERQQLLAIAHHTELDISGWPWDYTASLYWYFEPQVVRRPGQPSRVLLNLHRAAVKAEGGVLHDSLVSGIGSQMQSSGNKLACEALRRIMQAAIQESGIPGAGAAVLEDNTRITWTYADPLPCNGLARMGFRTSCQTGVTGDYRAVPPVLIFHKD